MFFHYNSINKMKGTFFWLMCHSLTVVINTKTPQWYAFNSKPKYKRNDSNEEKNHILMMRKWMMNNFAVWLHYMYTYSLTTLQNCSSFISSLWECGFLSSFLSFLLYFGLELKAYHWGVLVLFTTNKEWHINQKNVSFNLLIAL